MTPSATRNEYGLRCSARNGSTSNWVYDVAVTESGGRREWHVRAWPQDAPSPGEGGEWYDVILAEVDSGSVQVIMANNHLATPYRGRGVAPALYPVLARRLRRRLLSSRISVPG